MRYCCRLHRLCGGKHLHSHWWIGACPDPEKISRGRLTPAQLPVWRWELFEPQASGISRWELDGANFFL